MAQELWADLIGAVVGSASTIISNWVTSISKIRSDDEARWQERQFRIEDQKREDQEAMQKAIEDEDKYWFDKSLKFLVIRSRIYRARSKNELMEADQALAAFLEETPEYLSGENMMLFYLYCNSDFRERHFDMTAQDADLQRFVKRLNEFNIPSGADIRKRRSDTTT
jgi:hypothetical protein